MSILVPKISAISRLTERSKALRLKDAMWWGELTRERAMLGVLCLLLVGSAYREMRIPIGSLLVHPYLVLLVPMFFLIAVPRISRFPRPILISLAGFEFLYILSVVLGNSSPDEILKIGAAGMTIVTTALMLRTKDDFLVAVLALSISVAFLSIQNILTGGAVFGVSAGKAIANRNAISLYVLPALLLSGYLALYPNTPKVMRLLLLVCLVIMTVATFLSANRSGWVSAIAIGVMLYGRGRRLRSTILVGILILSVYYAVTYSGLVTFEKRMEQTVQGNESDTIRKELVFTTLSIAFEHPILGTSPLELQYELARRRPQDGIAVGSKDPVRVLDPHNVLMQILAGCGIITFAVFLSLAWQLWKRPRLARRVRSAVNGASGSHALLRMMMVLWLVRGMFTREILYSPTFSIGLGLTIGLCVLNGVWDPKDNPIHARVRRLHLTPPRRYLPPRRGRSSAEKP